MEITRWNRIQTGGGHLVRHAEGLRLLTIGARHNQYTDAQIDDYSGLPRRRFPWCAPLHMQLRARACGPLLGTAGFGFWNNPLTPFGGIPALPAAVWFFHASPPSHLPLEIGVSGSGWVCMTVDATTSRALRWAPLAPAVLLANNLPGVERRLWPLVQRDLAIAIQPIAAPSEHWQTYALDWHTNHVRFFIDGALQLEAPFAPRGPLGFVAWIDNQYAIATPRGRLSWGLLDAPAAQWLDVQELSVTDGTTAAGTQVAL